MSTINRRRFTLLGLGTVASASLVACGNDVGNEQAVNPTMIAGVEGAPPTLVPGTPGAAAEEPEADSGSASGGGGAAVEVDMQDTLKFVPAELTLAPGTVLTIKNGGVLQHNFVIDELGGEISPLLNGGETHEWEVSDQAGTYTFYCSVPGHRQGGMEGTLIIDPNAAPAAGEESASPAAAEGEEAPAEAPAEEAAASGPIEVDMLDTLKFEPAEITAAAGTVLVIKNAGVLQHNFVADDLGGEISPLLNGGETHEWTVEGDPGTYEFYCSVPGHKESGMVGTLTIQ